MAAPPSPPISAPLPAEPVTEPMMAPVPAPSNPPDNARSDCVVPQAETEPLSMSAAIAIFVFLQFTRTMDVASDGLRPSKRRRDAKVPNAQIDKPAKRGA